jgi:putative transcriptional regulator
VSERPLAALLEATGEPDPHAKGSVRIHAGGPVEPSVGLVIHSADYKRKATIDIDGRVAMTASREVLRDIARGRGPNKILVAFGYAGWGPGQLEREIADGGWFTAPEEPSLVFDAARDVLWREAMARRTRDL